MPRTRFLLLLIAGTFLVAGLADPFMPPAGRLAALTGLAHGILFTVLCYLWCKADAGERGTPHVGGAALAAFIPPIGLPVYFFRTRTVGKAFVSIGKSVLFVAASLAIYVLGAFVVESLRGVA